VHRAEENTMCGLGRWSGNTLHLPAEDRMLFLVPVQRPGFLWGWKNAISKHWAVVEMVPWQPHLETDLQKCNSVPFEPRFLTESPLEQLFLPLEGRMSSRSSRTFTVLGEVLCGRRDKGRAEFCLGSICNERISPALLAGLQNGRNDRKIQVSYWSRTVVLHWN